MTTNSFLDDYQDVKLILEEEYTVISVKELKGQIYIITSRVPDMIELECICTEQEFNFEYNNGTLIIGPYAFRELSQHLRELWGEYGDVESEANSNLMREVI